MDFDVNSHLIAVERTASSLELQGQPACAVTLSRNFTTLVAELWDCITNAERIPRWFLPIHGDLKPRGRFQLEGNAGGTIKVCERMSHIALTWEYGEDVSWLEVWFSAVGNGCARLTLTHTALFSEHWTMYGPGATGVGWEMSFLGLALHLMHPTAPKPDEIAFVTSSLGKSFIEGSSEGWRQAAVAMGTETESAHEAAIRTTAFYTGESNDPV